MDGGLQGLVSSRRRPALRPADGLRPEDSFHHRLQGDAQPAIRGTYRQFKALMRHNGLPEAIRVDNGTPFASVGLAGLSRLSVWWISQGIRVEFTRPGCPQDNGSHERMHRDLKAEATKPPSSNMKAQKRRFNRWVDEFNNERPHEALDMLAPSELYLRSERRLNECDIIWYPKGYDVKTVSDCGFLYYEGRNRRCLRRAEDRLAKNLQEDGGGPLRQRSPRPPRLRQRRGPIPACGLHRSPSLQNPRHDQPSKP
ncbi:MAG: hypothetical protein ACI92G_000013 [Candidatus Pelagisphaera sp.]|jgi:hypothetical protein